jgi:dCMP deaminase
MNNWDKKFLSVAALVATWSKDPSTQVGCVVTDSDHNQLSEGFNGFPRNIVDDNRLHDRETKLKLIVHAEANAVSAAARNGHALKGSTAYVTLPPCAQCAALLIQAGVYRVVFLSGVKPSKWEKDWVLAQGLLSEAGIEFEEVEREQFYKKPFEFLIDEFLDAMNDIGRYGEEKYGVESFHARAVSGDRSRSMKRTEKEEIVRHICAHASAYESGVKHDHFGTLKHQLAAASFNAMMEFYFSQHEQGK